MNTGLSFHACFRGPGSTLDRKEHAIKLRCTKAWKAWREYCVVLSSSQTGTSCILQTSPYSPGWPECHNPPTLASWVLRLWTHAAKACFVCSFFCFPTQIYFRARAAMKKFFESKNVRELCLSKNPFVPCLRRLCSPTVSAPSALFIQQSQYCSPLTTTYCGREDAWFVNCGQKATVA